MARPGRFTVRLADQEIASIKAFADENHLIESAAVRWLIAVGLAAESRAGCRIVGRIRMLLVRKQPRHDEIDRRKIMIPRRSIGEDYS